MKLKIILLSILFINGMTYSQAPKIYVNLGTHNEMIGESYDTNENEYDSAKTVALQILNYVNGIDAKWNFQTCSKFVLGALNWDNAATSSTDLLQTMQASGNVEIDPRNKTEFPNYMYNISDVYHLLDSCGITSTHTVGGFLAYPYNQEDWTQFRNPKIGAVYGEPWQAEIIWGGGSPNHIQDLNDYGVWKPTAGDSYDNLYTHDPNANLWMVGNGCAPVIDDTTSSVQWIVNLINANAQHVLNGDWPSDKFYCFTVMINVRDFDLPGYFSKVQTVLDAIDAQVTAGAMEWATISEKFAAFQAWSSTNSIASSEWSCAQAINGLNENQSNRFVLAPNPVVSSLNIEGLEGNVSYEIYDTHGKILNFGEVNAGASSIELGHLISGIYFVNIDGQVYKILKE